MQNMSPKPKAAFKYFEEFELFCLLKKQKKHIHIIPHLSLPHFEDVWK